MNALVAEFVLIVVTLIAAIVVGGFVFGLFGSYVPPAEVAAQVSSCSSSGTAEVCQVTLANMGPRNVETTGCSLALHGSNLPGSITNGGTVPASGLLSGVGCVVQGASAPAGSRLVGSIGLTNGATIFFTTVSS